MTTEYKIIREQHKFADSGKKFHKFLLAEIIRDPLTEELVSYIPYKYSDEVSLSGINSIEHFKYNASIVLANVQLFEKILLDALISPVLYRENFSAYSENKDIIDINPLTKPHIDEIGLSDVIDRMADIVKDIFIKYPSVKEKDPTYEEMYKFLSLQDKTKLKIATEDLANIYSTNDFIQNN